MEPKADLDPNQDSHCTTYDFVWLGSGWVCLCWTLLVIFFFAPLLAVFFTSCVTCSKLVFFNKDDSSGIYFIYFFSDTTTRGISLLPRGWRRSSRSGPLSTCPGKIGTGTACCGAAPVPAPQLCFFYLQFFWALKFNLKNIPASDYPGIVALHYP